VQAAVASMITGRAAHWLNILKIASVATTVAVSAAGAVAVVLATARLWQTTRRAEGTRLPLAFRLTQNHVKAVTVAGMRGL